MMITGCNDTSDVPKYADPPLTTVSLPMVECGRRAGGMLLELLKGGKPDNAMLAPRLVCRESTQRKTTDRQ